jgi:L-ascorbate metabolism protein UlaG (beta-lactamase superfamily)
MKITYYGHSAFTVEVSNTTLLFDPFISPNEMARHIDVPKINADYILVSHGHEDHVADLLSIAKKTGAKVLSNWEIYVWVGNKGISNAHPMNTGGSWMFDFGKVKCVSAVHSSSLPDGSYGGNPMGFIIESAEGQFYYSGDTALTYDMRLIGEQHKLKCAFLPIGDNFTMGVDDALTASSFINCSKIVGMHYDTFGFIKIDKNSAKEKFRKAGKELILMDIGSSVTL